MHERTRGPLYVVPGGQARGAADPTDAELVAGCLRQEEWAATAVWARYAPMVRRIMKRAVGPGHAVEDLVQEAFLRLYRKLPELRETGALKAFVVTITTRVLQTELRNRWIKRWLGLSDSGEVPEQAVEAGDHEAREALHRFYGLLDGLRPKHRTVFVLRHVEGLELVEVAAATGVSLATVKRWLPGIARRVHREAARDPLLASYVTAGAFGGGGGS